MTLEVDEHQAPKLLNAPGSGQSIHLAYLDGVRGLAALYVLLEHIQLSGLDLINARALAPGAGTHLQRFALFLNSSVLGFGHLAVDVFIVLSGYCLMLPVVTSPDQNLRGGLRAYIARRAWRILPPYYVALALALIFAVPNGVINMYSRGDVITHLLLVHNANPAWLFSINPPMWSIAVEWQIYFIFALLLLPVWRAAGNGAALLVAFVLGLSPIYLLPSSFNIEWSCPWYIGLFAMGMVAANVSLKRISPRAWRIPWLMVAALLVMLTGLTFLWQRNPHVHELWVRWFRIASRGFGWPLDVLAGAAVACALLGLTRAQYSATGAFAQKTLRLLRSRPLALLGAFSYSLYLAHAPVTSFVFGRLGRMNLSPGLG
ncbi:MAG TPA: acyltransferase, partial [Humisphaera sp.]|nr:acyltransferase [Humisphaera sp.]